MKNQQNQIKRIIPKNAYQENVTRVIWCSYLGMFSEQCEKIMSNPENVKLTTQNFREGKFSYLVKLDSGDLKDFILRNLNSISAQTKFSEEKIKAVANNIPKMKDVHNISNLIKITVRKFIEQEFYKGDSEEMLFLDLIRDGINALDPKELSEPKADLNESKAKLSASDSYYVEQMKIIFGLCDDQFNSADHKAL
jgi:hypothetical protein